MKKLLTIAVTLIALFALSHLLYAIEEPVSSQQGNEAAQEPSIEPETEPEVDTKIIKNASLASYSLPEDVKSGSVGQGISLSPLLSESFQTDLATGASTVSIPIVVPPGRKNMQPNIALFYSSNNSNGICGVGWALTSSSIQRSTKKGAPKYDNTDTFVFASSGSSGELIPINEEKREYRQKIETAFMKYVFSDNTWTVYDKSGAKYTFGAQADSRIDTGTKVFAWFLDRAEDVYGNYITYIYDKPGDGEIYLKEIRYTGGNGLTPDKNVILNYEERQDKLYNMRAGWEIKTAKRLKEITINVDGALQWRYVVGYSESPDTSRSLLTGITLFDKNGNSLPRKNFTYQTVEE